MRTLNKLTLIIASICSLSAYADDMTPLEQQAYSVGGTVGAYVSRQVKDFETLGNKMDPKFITKGFTDAIAEKTELTNEQMTEILQNIAKQLNEKVVAESKIIADKNAVIADDFLEKNKTKNGVITTKTGLQYIVNTMGSGEKPGAADMLEINYKGSLIDGTVFEDTYEKQKPAYISPFSVIDGLNEALQLMPVGSKFRFFIPPALAYGAQTVEVIPPNSVLIFDVELLSKKTPIESMKVIQDSKGSTGGMGGMGNPHSGMDMPPAAN